MLARSKFRWKSEWNIHDLTASILAAKVLLGSEFSTRAYLTTSQAFRSASLIRSSDWLGGSLVLKGQRVRPQSIWDKTEPKLREYFPLRIERPRPFGVNS